jgi:hypothetical protein
MWATTQPGIFSGASVNNLQLQQDRPGRATHKMPDHTALTANHHQETLVYTIWLYFLEMHVNRVSELTTGQNLAYNRQ